MNELICKKKRMKNKTLNFFFVKMAIIVANNHTNPH